MIKNIILKKSLLVENATKKDIFNAFTELSKLTTTNDYVLVYYSGHGQIKSEQPIGYLMMVVKNGAQTG